MQIRNAIIAEIAVNKFHDGEILPTVRTLSAEIGVNLHTVNKAYRLLQREGFIKITRKRGAVIHVESTQERIAHFLENMHTLLLTIVSEAIVRGVDRSVFHDMINDLYDKSILLDNPVEG